MSVSPVATPCAASITALRPEPQTLLMVRAPTLGGRPPLMAACPAGAWPRPADRHLPPLPPPPPARPPTGPAAGGRKLLSARMNLPVGSRTADRITASRIVSSFRSLDVTGHGQQEPRADVGVRYVVCGVVDLRGRTRTRLDGCSHCGHQR